MTALSPLARAFVEQTVQSASLDQKHRAQLWAQLQRRVSAESSSVSPSQSPMAGVLRLVLKTPLGWAGSVVVSGAILVGVLGATHRLDRTTKATAFDACPPAPKPSCEACFAPATIANASTPAVPPKVITESKPSKPAAPRGAGSRSRSAPPPPKRVATMPPRRDLQAVVVEPSRGVPGMHPVYTRFSYELDLAPHLVGGISPLGEGQFEPPVPLRLTQPQLRLTSTVLE
jgi:hypothetical protein